MAANSTVNYYELLDVAKDSTEKEIIKAYRKKALICHPDKNPDNSKAAQIFHEISEALKILTDKKAKAAYDAVLKAKELAKLRTKALDAKRKKFKEDLEARESSAQRSQEQDQKAKRNLEEEIKRLREEGSRLLREQQELIKTQIQKEDELIQNELITPKIKVKWKSSKSDRNNSGYNEEVLRNIFEKYGNVINILVSMKKNGLAIIEFHHPTAAVMALEFEHGLEENPLTLSWLQRPKVMDETEFESKPDVPTISKTHFEESIVKETSATSKESDTDFESMVLNRMKMAQKSKALDEA
eukprot:gene19958-21913_t